jgi:hypothetical protein
MQGRYRVAWAVVALLVSSAVGFVVTAALQHPAAPPRPTIFGVGPGAEPVWCAWEGGDPSTPMPPYGETPCTPVAAGQSLGVFEAPAAGAKRWNDAVARVAYREPGSKQVHVGPVLMTFPNASGGVRPSVVYGGGAIWLYDCATEHGSEVLRISPSTGRVLARFAMPNFSRPIIAANDEGFFMAPDTDSLFDPPRPTLGIYVVPLGATHYVLAKATGGWVESMSGTADTMNVEVSLPGEASAQSTLTYHFAGPIGW